MPTTWGLDAALRAIERSGDDWSRERPNGFKSIRDSLSTAAPTWAFSTLAHYVIQDHPAYIPRSQRWPLRPELAPALDVWLLSQPDRCAARCACWRL
jgi:hypothetical protein